VPARVLHQRDWEAQIVTPMQSDHTKAAAAGARQALLGHMKALADERRAERAGVSSWR
jgi:hypothetical protein